MSTKKTTKRAVKKAIKKTIAAEAKPIAVDPEYRIAYDVDRCKVGCILIQAAHGCDVPKDLFFRYFSSEGWTVNAQHCQIYPIRRSQLPQLAARTRFESKPVK